MLNHCAPFWKTKPSGRRRVRVYAEAELQRGGEIAQRPAHGGLSDVIALQG